MNDREIHAALTAAICVPTTAHLWTPAHAITYVPALLTQQFGDGRALLGLATINQRPAHYVIRIDSGWVLALDDDQPDDAPDVVEFTNEILTALEDEFGSGRCSYSRSSLFRSKAERECDCEDCENDYVATWPEVDGYGGCSWWREAWPEIPGIALAPHPFSWRDNLMVGAGP